MAILDRYRGGLKTLNMFAPDNHSNICRITLAPHRSVVYHMEDKKCSKTS